MKSLSEYLKMMLLVCIQILIAASAFLQAMEIKWYNIDNNNPWIKTIRISPNGDKVYVILGGISNNSYGIKPNKIYGPTYTIREIDASNGCLLKLDSVKYMSNNVLIFDLDIIDDTTIVLACNYYDKRSHYLLKYDHKNDTSFNYQILPYNMNEQDQQLGCFPLTSVKYVKNNKIYLAGRELNCMRNTGYSSVFEIQIGAHYIIDSMDSVRLFIASGGVSNIDYSNNGQYYAFADNLDGGHGLSSGSKFFYVKVYDPSFKNIATINSGSEINSISFSPDSKMLAALTLDGKISFYGIPGFQLINSISVSNDPFSIKFDKSNRYLIVGGNGNVGMLELNTMQYIDSRSLSGGYVTTIDVSPDSTYIAIGTAGGWYYMLESTYLSKGLHSLFTAEKMYGLPLEVKFFDLSTGNPISWHWDFGDGSTSDEQNPKHVYQNKGTYAVKLIVSDGKNKDSLKKWNFIVIEDFTDIAEPVITNNIELNVMPNPIDANSTISLYIPKASNIKLSLFDVLGNEFHNFQNGFLSPGYYTYTFESIKTLAYRIYFLVLHNNYECYTTKVYLK